MSFTQVQTRHRTSPASFTHPRTRIDAPRTAASAEKADLEWYTWSVLLDQFQKAVDLKTPLHISGRIQDSCGSKDLQALTTTTAQIRFCWDSVTKCFLAKYMPTTIHEKAKSCFGPAFTEAFSATTNLPFMEYGDLGGSATVKLSPTRTKEADESVCSNTRQVSDCPVLAMEVGVADSRTKLIIAAGWWLESNTNIVLIVIADRKEKKLVMERWQRDTSPPPKALRTPMKPAPVSVETVVLQDPFETPLEEYRTPTISLPWELLELGLPSPYTSGNLVVDLTRWSKAVWRAMRADM
ncbi:hypothetical protein MSAN_00352300 [Mycena sanguinolenta]|uniref:Uncharacterized protein n=1 Tax=Mycena sanguinolenta TaxID=230812 RepID=A0A8H6Z8V0_9AGAR|nr:hypothetical protein MSAN_00352300 [Mycena sanguinolenta]